MHPAALRKMLAEIIAAEKSYNVPSICLALGLEPGSEAEAFNGKMQFALKRLSNVEESQLNNCAIRLSTLIESSKLMEFLAASKNTSPSDDIHSSSLATLQVDHIDQRWQGALARRDNDPEGAITLARTLLEDVCKSIITQMQGTYLEKDDLPQLYRKTAVLMNLAPDQHTEQVFKQILGGCQTIVESLGAIRNKLGDAHSPGPVRARPARRHAMLAVNLAGAMATFLAETYTEVSD
jgi:Abortive infection C-terminus